MVCNAAVTLCETGRESHAAGMAKLADAADLKSAGPKGLWGFDSPSRHHSERDPALVVRSE
jgi:hypothetical protein